MAAIEHRGSFKNLEKFLSAMRKNKMFDVLDSFAREGVAALTNSTPERTGLSASSWGYEIESTGRTHSIIWTNTNKTKTGIPIVILLRYGHGTGTGGYVQGYDFISPPLRPIFDRIAKDVWKAVTSA